MFLAFGKRDAAEAYRRSFLRKNARGEWVDSPRGSGLPMDQVNTAEVLSPKDCSKRASALLRQQHIQDTLAELERSPSELARKTLADQLLFGTEREKTKAVERVMAEEDKLGFRDAAEKWAEIMCDIGAEVVVPLGVITRQFACQHCREINEVDIDLSTEVPLSEFFPNHRTASAAD